MPSANISGDSYLYNLSRTALGIWSFGHSIIQYARPKSVITPTLFGIGVEMDHVFGLGCK